MKVFQVWATEAGESPLLVGTYASGAAACRAEAWLRAHSDREPQRPGSGRTQEYCEAMDAWRQEAGAYVPGCWDCMYSVTSVDVLDESQFPTLKETT